MTLPNRDLGNKIKRAVISNSSESKISKPFWADSEEERIGLLFCLFLKHKLGNCMTLTTYNGKNFLILRDNGLRIWLEESD